ncbi:MAG TPA: hypothetical protein PLN03_13000 [Spirochaetota bacterium]|nr:hypothetical protein [Spirochaetota bacterium]HOK93726.1 hypothetical protein [Spirochaetota bacterium]
MLDDGKFVCDECRQPLDFSTVSIRNNVGLLVANCEKCRIRYEVTFQVLMATQMKLKEEDFEELEG